MMNEGGLINIRQMIRGSSHLLFYLSTRSFYLFYQTFFGYHEAKSTVKVHITGS